MNISHPMKKFEVSTKAWKKVLNVEQIVKSSATFEMVKEYRLVDDGK